MLTNIRLVIEACRNLQFSYDILHEHQNLLRIKLDKHYYFCNWSTPFNSHSIANIITDKEYTYQILKNKVNTPRTMGFVSPFWQENKKHIKLQNIEEIALEINQNFTIPMIIKRNSGNAGKNVFLCQNKNQVKTSLEKIFDIHSKDYDYVALAQDFIEINKEYRAIFFNKELLLVYEKNKANAKFVGNLSPLHWEGAKAEQIVETKILDAIDDFTQPVFQELEINYAGFDIALDKYGEYWLIEINTSPSYDIFVRDNGENVTIKIFEKMLKNLI